MTRSESSMINTLSITIHLSSGLIYYILDKYVRLICLLGQYVRNNLIIDITQQFKQSMKAKKNVNAILSQDKSESCHGA